MQVNIWRYVVMETTLDPQRSHERDAQRIHCDPGLTDLDSWKTKTLLLLLGENQSEDERNPQVLNSSGAGKLIH